MDFSIFICILLLLFDPSEERAKRIRDKRSLHVPPLDAPSFLRSDVEHSSKPWQIFKDRSATYLDTSEFGSKSLPLRNAVEYVPDVVEATHRLPLRDAVEKRPPPDEAFDLEIDIPQQNIWPSFFQENPEKYAFAQKTQYVPLVYFNKIVHGVPIYRSEIFNNQYVSLPNERRSKSILPDIDSEFINNQIYSRGNEKDLKRIVCYVESVAGYRRQPMTFNPENVDPFMCTHVIYAFAQIDPHSYEIMTRDEEYDLIRGGYRSITGLKRKNPHLKVLIAITERNSQRFQNLTSIPSLRNNFIASLQTFIVKHNFDGIDLHWNFNSNDILNKYHNEEEEFGQLLNELSYVFQQNKWILAVSVPAVRFRNEIHFDSIQLATKVDFVNVQAHDFHNEVYLVTHAPLVLKKSSLDASNNIEYAVNYWLKRGLPRSKLVIGIPFFGRTFTFQYLNTSEVEAIVTGPGSEGYYTQNPGYLSYFEVCDIINHFKLSKKTDLLGNPYVTYQNQWISYDDPDSISHKVRYIKELNLGGLFVWSIDLDDFRGYCGKKWPLMTTVLNYLKTDHQDYQDESSAIAPLGTCITDGVYSDPRNCANFYMCRGGLSYLLSCGPKLLFNTKLAKCDYIDPSLCQPGQITFVATPSHPNSIRSGNIRSMDKSPKVVCYVTNWSFYRKGDGKFVPENLDNGLCTHIIYAFSTLEPESLMIKEFDPWADIENGLYDRVNALKDSKVLLALGGWTDSAGDKYSKLISSGSSRHKFVLGVVSFLRRHGFEGLHLDWNYPICWQSNCRKGPASDKPNFTKLLQELRQEFDKESPPLSLGVAISGYKEVIDVAYDLAAIGKAADFLSVMTYDYHGSWEKRTGHVSPLYHRPDDQYPQYNTNFTMEYLVSNGAPREKLLVGIPFYGQSFKVSKSSGRYDQGTPSSGQGDAGEYTKQPGMLAYYEICSRVKNHRWVVNRDPNGATGPYAHSGDQWIGYEDVDSVRLKANYIKKNGYGGAVAWTVDLDDFQNKCCQKAFPLLRSLNVGLGLLSSLETFSGDCTKPPQPATPVPPMLTTGFDTGSHNSPTTEHNHWEHFTSTTTKKPMSTPWWMSSTESVTTTTTTTTEKPVTWWSHPPTPSSTTTEEPVTWWSQPVTTPSTTTEKVTWWKPDTTTVLSTLSTTVSSTPWWKPQEDDDVTTIPTPAVVMPEIETDVPIKCETGQYFHDPHNCNAYYRCVLGERKKQYCAGGLHWNKQSGICDWPAVANCEEKKQISKPAKPSRPNKPSASAPTTSWKPPPTTASSTTTTTRRTTTEYVYTTTTTTTKPSPTPPLEECQSGAYYPHEQCSNFYVCVNSQLVTQKCGPGLHWNVESGLCDWGYKTKCLSRNQLALQTNKMLKENYGVAHSPDSSCQAGSYSSYSGDCTQYLFCLWDKYEAFSCASGLHWNNDQKICDWPENAACTESGNQNDDEELTEKPTRPTVASPDHPTQSTTEKEWWSSSSASPSTTTTTEEVPSEPLEPLSGYYKIVCYFTNWAWYRKGLGKYVPEDIDANLCTHIVYGFAVLDYSELTVRAHDSWADYDNKFYSRVVAYKKKGLKVSLALGGWNDSMGDKYSRLVNSPAARAKFIKHVLEFLEKYDFDGLDLDWEYPKCWQVDCKKGPDSDKQGFAAFVSELREAFKPKNYLLSSAVSPSRTVIDAGYDVPSLARDFDWIAVMTYDFHGQWDKQTGHVAPMLFHPEDENAYFNANYSINYWISEGVPSRKIVMGMPLYGQSFQLENANNNGLNAKAPGPGQAGEFTRAAGFLAYYEICDRIKNKGWTVVQDPKHRMGPYAYKGNQWVSFDDKEMIRRKSEYVRKMDLGGGMIWALDLDDFKNRCGEGKHPLLTTIRKVLAGPGNGVSGPVDPQEDDDFDESPMTTQASLPPSVDHPTVSTPVAHSTTEPPKVDPNSSFKVVCYFTNWAWYRQGVGKFLPGDIDPDLCTHIVYGFAVLNGDSLVIKPHDTWADYDNKFYEKVTAFKAKGIKVLIAIGGWNDSAGDKYSRLVNNPSARRRFIETVSEFIEKNNFDGLDLDWEYPKCWQVDCNKGPASDKQGFSAFVKELHEAFQPKGWLLSAAVSPAKRVVDAGYDVPALSRYLDWIAVMCYDYHGQWDKITGHVAPMYPHPEDEDATFNTNFTIHYWINQGADRQKIVMGMPTYGQSFSLRERNEHGLNAPTYGGGEAGDETRARGFLSYYEICTNIRKKSWTVVRDKKNRIGPYAHGGDQWVSFDDIPQIRLKSEYIKSMGLGGGMIWALDLDDFKNLCGCETYPLLKTINRVLRDYAVPAPTCELGGEKSYPVVTKKPKPVTQKPVESWKTSTEYRWQPTSVQTLKPSLVQTPKPPKSLPCSGRLFVADKSNCNQYFLCNQGALMLQSCPSGLYWNEDHCDWPENTKCHPDGTTVQPSTPEITEVYQPEVPDDEIEIATTPKPFHPGTTTINPNGEAYKVVCYFTNWAWYRQEKGKYVPDDIDPSLCTHITYGFAVLDSTTLTIKSHDPWADVDNEFYKKVVKFKSYGIKVLIALGGWNDSLGNKYSRLVNDPQARARFIKHMVKFIEEWGFDGLDLDWEYPKCWQVDCNKGPSSDKQGFASLVAELSAVFKPRGWLLSAAVSPSKTVIDAGYDVPSLSKHFDWIAVMTYDFHGHWDKQTGHVAPLYYYPGDTYDYFNANFSINYWIEMGAPPSKLVMGMPLYGQTFSLADQSKDGLNEKSYGPGEAGDYTRAGGFMAFYEICERVKRRSWMVTRDPQGRIGPYAISGNQWVSYDDIAEIRRKTKFLKDLGLGGGMIWALDLDDFRNTCGCGRHPLLKAMNNELRGVPVDVNIDNCT